MKKKEIAFAGLLIAGGIVVVLSMIANNPRINPLWRNVARTAEGDVFKHIITGELVTLLA